METLLNVDDNAEILNQLKWGFKKNFEVHGAADRDEALALFKKHKPRVVTLDLGLPPDPDGVEEGMTCLSEILALSPTTKVIVITGKGERENALRAISLGAWDFYSKPINLPELKVMLERAFHVFELERENRKNLSERIESKTTGEMLGVSKAMQNVFRTINKVAASDVPVLILGESGTGKELVARAIHARSNRKNNSFVAINCGAIPENLLEAELFGHEKGSFTGAHARVLGKVEYADKGTLFLDEIGEMPTPLQVNLLRFLQEKVFQRVGGRENIPSDTRVLAATNINIQKAIADGSFREDLYYRLGVITIELPPLRERKEDIELLAIWFLSRFAREYSRNLRGFSDRAMAMMCEYPWPGNIRELENKVKRAVIMAEGSVVAPRDLAFPGYGDDGDADAEEADLGQSQGGRNYEGPEEVEPLAVARSRIEAKLLKLALNACNGNIVRAAESLGVSRPTFYDLMKRHNVRQG